MILEIMKVVIPAAALGMSFLAFFYKSLLGRIKALENEMHSKPNFDHMGQEINKSLAPHAVEYRMMSRRLDELKTSQDKLNDKLDKIYEKLTNGRH